MLSFHTGRHCLQRKEMHMEQALIIMIVLVLLGLLFYISMKFQSRPAQTQGQDQSGYENDPGSNWTDRKGQEGENEVQRILFRLPREKYIVLNDVLLPTGKGMTQIDHVIVSLYGVFVIESKNYKGKIYGTHDSEKWSQYINGEQYNFRNPIKQNLGHVMAIERVAHISGRAIIPLVVFTGSATLKVLGCNEVVYDGMLYETICRYTDIFFTPEQMTQIAKIIDDKIEENRETKTAHINEVRERIVRWDEEIKAGQCPRCDGYLVRRKGKYGDFYGCSNYPSCKYTKNI